ncbi:hypothetical protein JCM6882_006887 [Rhodosporidiobolus microsporus]
MATSQERLADLELGTKQEGTYVQKGEGGADTQVVMRGLDADSPEGTVHRGLKARHLQMIALGGCIGTGLFVGAGSALATGGPLGLWLGYSIMGLPVGSMMIALGELTTLYPVSGAFVHYTSRFVDPTVGFALGWNYWYSYAITLPTEITAAALVIQFWRDDINVAVWITVFYVVICGFNFLCVRSQTLKKPLCSILGLILLGIIITAGGVPGQEPIGFRCEFSYFVTCRICTEGRCPPSGTWRARCSSSTGFPGAKGRFLAFWSTLTQGAFSYLGTEIVALTAGEAQNPRRNMPKAIRRVFFCIAFFYVIGTFVMGLIVSPNDPDLTNADSVNASPWVIAINNAGIEALPSIFNAAVLLSAFSAGNSDLYASSRTLYGLACDGKAPAIFRRCTKSGLPIWCLVATAAVGLLAYMNVSTGSTTAFNYLSSLSTITGLITWACINLSFIRFYHGCKAHGLDRNEHPFKAPLQPWASYIGLVMFILVIFFNGFTVFLSESWDTGTFIVDYVTIVIFAVLMVGWKLWKRTKFVRIETTDFYTSRCELDQMAEDKAAKYQKPTFILGKVWDRLC